MKNTINLFIENYYDFHTSSYYKILSLSNIPEGPLKKYIKITSIKATSTKITNSKMNYCSYVINKNIYNDTSINSSTNTSITNFINNKFNLCTLEDLSILYDFLSNNNYILNNEYNNLITNLNITSLGSDNPIHNIFENKKLLFSFYYN
tara:strand:- start:129 stop:575 length:447 start_codon:yes stop_codon:yes gene_type:complete